MQKFCEINELGYLALKFLKDTILIFAKNRKP